MLYLQLSELSLCLRREVHAYVWLLVAARRYVVIICLRLRRDAWLDRLGDRGHLRQNAAIVVVQRQVLKVLLLWLVV